MKCVQWNWHQYCSPCNDFPIVWCLSLSFVCYFSTVSWSINTLKMIFRSVCSIAVSNMEIMTYCKWEIHYNFYSTMLSHVIDVWYCQRRREILTEVEELFWGYFYSSDKLHEIPYRLFIKVTGGAVCSQNSFQILSLALHDQIMFSDMLHLHFYSWGVFFVSEFLHLEETLEKLKEAI